jgi:hypothetical protein
MTKVVSEGRRLAKILVEHKSAADDTGDLSYLKGMGKACSVMLIHGKKEYLGLMHKSPECL